ncbi:MAG TPA: hypothetical protein VL371_06400 [Gemmataceae bacterium]|nr:hypothetical protein [Gemmataceae bacterium]
MGSRHRLAGTATSSKSPDRAGSGLWLTPRGAWTEACLQVDSFAVRAKLARESIQQHDDKRLRKQK